ncbi:MAG: NUDIX domain-containing protein, partial [Candidatus Bathyarchaeia archaeon]
AARREVLEETGISVRIERLIGVFENILRDDEGRVKFHYVLVEYLASPLAGALRASSESFEARWVSLSQVRRLKTTRTALSVLEKAGLLPQG